MRERIREAGGSSSPRGWWGWGHMDQSWGSASPSEPIQKAEDVCQENQSDRDGPSLPLWRASSRGVGAGGSLVAFELLAFAPFRGPPVSPQLFHPCSPQLFLRTCGLAPEHPGVRPPPLPLSALFTVSLLQTCPPAHPAGSGGGAMWAPFSGGRARAGDGSPPALTVVIHQLCNSAALKCSS